MRIAYFVNQYPKVSHSFIRREIAALEKQCFEILRISLRGWDEVLVDQEDVREQKQTKYILKNGSLRLLACSLKIFTLFPLKFLKTLSSAVKLGASSSKSVLYYVVYFMEACVLLTWMRESGCQHLHAHFGTNPAQVAMFTHLLGGVEYSFTVHGPEEFDMPRFLHIKETARHAKFVLAISSFGKSQLYRHIDYKDWPKIHEVHCGLEPEFLNCASKPVANTNRLVCVGRLCEQKGQLLLVQALHQLKQDGTSIELVLAGDGEMRGEIESLIARYNLADNIRITGWIDSAQVREEIQNSRAMIFCCGAYGYECQSKDDTSGHAGAGKNGRRSAGRCAIWFNQCIEYHRALRIDLRCASSSTDTHDDP